VLVALLAGQESNLNRVLSQLLLWRCHKRIKCLLGVYPKQIQNYALHPLPYLNPQQDLFQVLDTNRFLYVGRPK